MSMRDFEEMKEEQRHLDRTARARAREAAHREEEKGDLHQHVDDLAVLTRALYVYVRSQPGFDAERFAEIVTRVQESVKREGEKPST